MKKHSENLTAQQKETQELIAKALQMGKPELKIEYYTGVIKVNPKSVEAYDNRGAAYYRSGEYQKAIE